MWYKNLYRRQLLDMHIEDWNPDFLSCFSPENYVENLKKADVNYTMIYFQSHVGLCYYPTKVGTIHTAFIKKPDLIKRTVDFCHKNNIRVCGYYSLIYNTCEHDNHPEWRMKCQNGLSLRESSADSMRKTFTNPKGSRYGFCCPTNPGYRQFVYDQIDEMLEYFDCDALFFDMPFWPHTCYCEYCRKAFGKDIPLNATIEHTEFKAHMIGEFVQSITDHVKNCRPDMPVEHNFAGAVAFDTYSGCLEEVLEACDYVGGDLYGDLYNHSFACKFYKNATKNEPFEQMLSRCKPTLRVHTLTKTDDELKMAMASTMAHHGATLVIDAIDPVGTIDSRVYELFGRIFSFQKKYEPYFTGQMVEEVGLYYGLRSCLHEEDITSRTCCINSCKTLIRAHIPFGVTGSYHTLKKYKILIAPFLTEMEKKDNCRLIEYVREGGTLYLSGLGNTELVEELTGHKCIRISAKQNLYLAPKPELEDIFGGFNKKYPLPFETIAPIVESGDCQVLATLTFPYTQPDDSRFASIHSDPPGVSTEIPAVTFNRYGKGKVLWSALPIENVEYEEYRRIFLRLIHMKGEPDYFFYTDAPVNVELTAFRNTNSTTVNVTVFDNEAFATPVAPFHIKIRAEALAVYQLPERKELPFIVKKGYTVFQTDTIRIFSMYEIKHDFITI